MNKYLILLLFSLNARAMDATGSKPVDGFFSDEQFAAAQKAFLQCCTKAQCEELQVNLRKRQGEFKPKPIKKRTKNTLPEGVLIYAVEEERALGNTGKLFISPSKPKNAIYCHFAVDNYLDGYIDFADRIDLGKMMKDMEIKSYKLSKEKHLYRVLAKTEVKLRNIFKNERILRNIVYTGLAEDFRSRAYGHGSDMCHAFTKKLASKKVKFESRLLESGKNIRMSYLIENIPKKYLEVFECLMAKLTLTFDFGASAKIGDDDSWKTINNYWESDIRKTDVQGSDFVDQIANLRNHIQSQVLSSPLQDEENDSGDDSQQYISTSEEESDCLTEEEI